jgi:DNA-binding transcriptional MerR regulator
LAEPEREASGYRRYAQRHIARVRQRLKALRALERQLVGLRARCDGDPSHACAILESFMTAANDHACASHPASSRA